VDKDPEEQRKETHRQREGSPGGAAKEGGEGDRRDQQVPPALETAREPDEATSTRQEPFPHEEERPQDGVERPWWRRIFRGPHEGAERPWWRRVFGG
jgi:hypothetical protein